MGPSRGRTGPLGALGRAGRLFPGPAGPLEPPGPWGRGPHFAFRALGWVFIGFLGLGGFGLGFFFLFFFLILWTLLFFLVSLKVCAADGVGSAWFSLDLLSLAFGDFVFLRGARCQCKSGAWAGLFSWAEPPLSGLIFVWGRSPRDAGVPGRRRRRRRGRYASLARARRRRSLWRKEEDKDNTVSRRVEGLRGSQLIYLDCVAALPRTTPRLFTQVVCRRFAVRRAGPWKDLAWRAGEGPSSLRLAPGPARAPPNQVPEELASPSAWARTPRRAQRKPRRAVPAGRPGG